MNMILAFIAGSVAMVCVALSLIVYKEVEEHCSKTLNDGGEEPVTMNGVHSGRRSHNCYTSCGGGDEWLS